MKQLLPIFFALVLLGSAVMHIVRPDAYLAMIPHFIPAGLANLLAAISEGIVGIALLVPQLRRWGGLGFALLMLAFLPIHIWDMLRENPAIGSTGVAIGRTLIQLVLIYLGWLIWKGYSSSQSPNSSPAG